MHILHELQWFTCSAWKLSRPVVGSSAAINEGSPNKPQAILNLFRSPPESPLTLGDPTIVSADFLSPSFCMRFSTSSLAFSAVDSGPSWSLAAVIRVSLKSIKINRSVNRSSFNFNSNIILKYRKDSMNRTPFSELSVQVTWKFS